MGITRFEIDFLVVGTGRSGDAILFRYEENGEFKVILIDGGYEDTADTILNHMKKYYGTNIIEHIICSHPDQDHIGGLAEIINKCDVGTLWINNPLHYIKRDELPDKDSEGRFTKGKADMVEKIIKVAKDNGVPVDTPMQGKSIGPLHVCSPSEDFYKDIVKDTLDWGANKNESFTERVMMLIQETMAKIPMIPAKWQTDALYKYPKTSSSNESSTVLFSNITIAEDEYKILLTADAGIQALIRAEKYISETQNFKAGSLAFIQMPHHGSRRNVNSDILDALLGDRIPDSHKPEKGISYVSAAKEDEDHPRKAVVNAFYTRGYNRATTKDGAKCFSNGMLPREGWGPISCGGFEDYVEEL